MSIKPINPLDPNERIIYKITAVDNPTIAELAEVQFEVDTIENLYTKVSKDKTIYVLHLNKLTKVKVKKFDFHGGYKLVYQNFLKITLENELTIETSYSHVNQTQNGRRKSHELKIGKDALPISITPLIGFGLDKVDGELIGLFMQNGLYFNPKDDSSQLIFGVLDKHKLPLVAALKRLKVKYVDADYTETKGENYTEFILNSVTAMSIVKNSLGVDGKTSQFMIKPTVLSKSIDFRNGILSGLAKANSTVSEGNMLTSYMFSINLGEKINYNEVAMLASSTGRLFYKEGREVRIYNKPHLLPEIVNKGYFWSTVISVEITYRGRYCYCLEVVEEDLPARLKRFNIVNGIVTLGC